MCWPGVARVARAGRNCCVFCVSSAPRPVSARLRRSNASFWRRAASPIRQSILAAIASDQGLSRCMEVTEVVVIVDAVNGAELLRDEALARAADLMRRLPHCHQDGRGRDLRMSCAFSTPCRASIPHAVRFGAVRGVEAPLPDVEAGVSREQREPPNDQDVRPGLRFGNSPWRRHVARVRSLAIGAAARARQ